MTQTAPIRETFKGIEAYINEANEIISKGDVVELNSLEDRVREMCDAIAAMSKDEAKEHKKDLERLMGDLQKLQTTLIENRDELQTELSGVHSHSAASQAYHKSGALAPKDE